MERFVESAPLPHGHPSYPSVSPLSLSSPASEAPSAHLPIPFSAIQSSSDVSEDDDVKASDSDLIPPSESDTNTSIPASNMLSEKQLIARGRVLLQAYQSQKKQWLESGEYDSPEVSHAQAPDSPNTTVNIFHPSNGEYSTLEYHSPTMKSITTAEAPSIGTKLEDQSPPPPPPSSPPPSSILLKTNGRMMDIVDAQLAQIWEELVSGDTNARGPQPVVDKLSEAVTQLLQQKREAEIAIAKLAEVLGSRVFLAGKLSDDAVQFVSNQLRLELQASQTLVDKVNAEKNSYKEELNGSVNGNSRTDEIAKLLRQQLQDKKEELQASQAEVAKLKDQLAQQKEAAAEKQKKFERALDVKLREIDALCSDIELPVEYERTKTTEGVTCYRKKGNEGNELEDPRVAIAIQQRSRSGDKDVIPTSTEITSSSKASRSQLKRYDSRVRASRSNSTAVNADIPRTEEGVEYFDVVFEESGPIGIHFQANIPDSGATVRSLLHDMAAEQKNVLQPFDELVAVNKNAVDSAPFRHVMLLLQGGLRPLTLTFKRDLNRPQRAMPPLQVTPLSDSGSSVSDHLDEEVLIDEGTVVDLEQLRVPVEPPQTTTEDEEDMNVADVIITNIFSLFWKPPETTGEVQTV
ncbi:2-hydroxyacid dehydrogenase 1 [Phytophthora nicotianae]|uniref:2-hydroxyacid dehydrogenase 1 n=1 Tax=Phytophthora nicotianae TaxID=4792 RepID=A0A0W8D7T9_PHYNI|nr:2-hydroxyacid dehydrogenase 1 [Phytophthora nicotianae]